MDANSFRFLNHFVLPFLLEAAGANTSERTEGTMHAKQNLN